MLIKKFLLFFTLTLIVTLGAAVIIGVQYGDFSSLINTIIEKPILLSGFFAAAIVAGVSSITGKYNRK